MAAKRVARPISAAAHPWRNPGHRWRSRTKYRLVHGNRASGNRSGPLFRCWECSSGATAAPIDRKIFGRVYEKRRGARLLHRDEPAVSLAARRYATRRRDRLVPFHTHEPNDPEIADRDSPAPDAYSSLA